MTDESGALSGDVAFSVYHRMKALPEVINYFASCLFTNVPYFYCPPFHFFLLSATLLVLRQELLLSIIVMQF